MIELIEHIDPEILSLLISVALIFFLWKGPKGFIILSVKGDLLWTGVMTFLTVRFFLLRNESTFGIQNMILLTACGLLLALLLFIPGFIPGILRRIGL